VPIRSLSGNNLLDIDQGSFYTQMMRVIATSRLRAFWEEYPDAEEPLQAWYRETEQRQWRNPAAVNEKHCAVRSIGNGRIVFNIRGDNYRLVVKINYPYGVVYVQFIGTHEEYDNIYAEGAAAS
jgi:mRNA interferase HigB